MLKYSQKIKQFIFTRFNALEIASFTYALLSALYILVFFAKIEASSLLLLFRVLFVMLICVFAYLGIGNRNRFFSFVRIAFPVSLILYWYPETSALNHGVLVPNLDAFFNQLEFDLFGCLPAILFSEKFPYAWFSELMYFSYFSFFIFYIYIILAHFFTASSDFMRASFTVLASFLVFYVIFIFVPVEGPVFYYPVEERYVPAGYLFSSLMCFLQEVAEEPTAAFPSSHVAMTIIFLIEIYKFRRKVFFLVLPVAILLFMSTVYIKAHYLVDVIGGFIAAPFVYCLVQRLYRVIATESEKCSTIRIEK